jgi:hypothetical protein
VSKCNSIEGIEISQEDLDIIRDAANAQAEADAVQLRDSPVV